MERRVGGGMRNIVAHIQNPQDDTAIEDFLRRTE